MRFEGLTRKMRVESIEPVQYYWVFCDDFLLMNALIGHRIRFDWLKTICLNCGEALPIFARGFCRHCFFSSPKAGQSIVRPELSRAHLGEEVRDLEWEQRFELQPHVVYLAFTDDVKVGVTRKTQIPTRWIDQGAMRAVVMLETPNRYLAGITEVALKEKLKDKTNWRSMLQAHGVAADLLQVKEAMKKCVPDEAQMYWVTAGDLHDFVYPLTHISDKIAGVRKFDKKSHFTVKLKGIKGQYLVFEDNTVLNVRAHEGYYLALDVG